MKQRELDEYSSKKKEKNGPADWREEKKKHLKEKNKVIWMLILDERTAKPWKRVEKWPGSK